MSWEHRGRTYSAAEYHHNRSQSEAEELRSANAGLRKEGDRIRAELNDTRAKLGRSQNDLQERARLQERLEQKQREYETIQGQIQQRQKEFETRTKKREQELEQEIRGAERHAEEKVRQLKAETDRQIAAVQDEITDVVQQMDQGLNEVRGEIKQTRRDMEDKVREVRSEIEAERSRRVQKENNRTSQAVSVLEWTESKSASLRDLDVLGLTIEKVRMQESINRAREVLGSGDGEMALPIAEVAASTYQTTFLEVERRIGVINGAAEHVYEIADAVTRIAQDEMLREVFPVEANQMDLAVEAFKARADEWRTQRRWTAFENERDKVIEAANRFIARAIELEAFVPGLVRQLEEREKKLDQVGEIVRTIAGAADSVELTYANSEDVKSPRLAKTHVGNACIDVYLELDGTYRVDAYGFDSPLQCSESASRMKHQLADKWTVSEEIVDPTNRQQALATASPAGESWRKVSSDLSYISPKLNNNR